jgi:hypothetical protein
MKHRRLSPPAEPGIGAVHQSRPVPIDLPCTAYKDRLLHRAIWLCHLFFFDYVAQIIKYHILSNPAKQLPSGFYMVDVEQM